MVSPKRNPLYWISCSLISFGLTIAASRSLAADDRPTVQVTAFGAMPDGTQVELYTLSNANGVKATVMTYGATLTGVWTPDRKGRTENITLYLETLDDYLAGHPLFGSVVGRYANRIAAAQFTLDGVTYDLTPNARTYHIHGGKQGFQKLVWDAEAVQGKDTAAVRLRHTSPDGNEGYPGNLAVQVTYELNQRNELTIHYQAETDKPTVVNLTNHAYWNLAGAGSGDVLGQVLTIHADYYLPIDSTKLPTGEIRSVRGTVMDFNRPAAIGARIEQEERQNYDHCYVLRKQPGQRLCFAARAIDPGSGRTMDVFTSKPGVQLYTAKQLSSKYKTEQFEYGPYHGFCLETQYFPDSPNRPNWPSPVLRPGERYDHMTVFRFGVQ